MRAPRVGGGYRLIVEPWRVTEILDAFRPTSVEVSDKSTLLPVAGWARRNGVRSVLFSHERLDAMLTLRTGWETGVDRLDRGAEPDPGPALRRGRGDVVVRTRRVLAACREGRHADPPDPARGRPRDLPPGPWPRPRRPAPVGPRRPAVAREEPAPRGRDRARAAPPRRTRPARRVRRGPAPCRAGADGARRAGRLPRPRRRPPPPQRPDRSRRRRAVGLPGRDLRARGPRGAGVRDAGRDRRRRRRSRAGRRGERRLGCADAGRARRRGAAPRGAAAAR